MKRILFVDDERHILNGLRRQLHEHRKEWAMTFAEGGPEAIAAIDQQEFDLIVTDMQMPVMDGAQVLGHVAVVQERCARLVLSGHADPVRIRLAASCVHRYLDKPCPPELLQLEIRQALSIRETLDGLGDPGLERLWCRKPSRDVALEGTSQWTQPILSSDAVKELLTKDEDLWSRVSAMLPRDDSARDPARAVRAFGAGTVLSLTMVARVFQTIGAVGVDLEAGVRIAPVAAKIAREQNQPEEVVSDAFVASLLHAGLAVGRDERHLDVLAYLLPTCGFSDDCVIAVTRGGRMEKPAGAALGVAGAVAAARLAAGQGRNGALVRFLELIGWGQGVDQWVHRGIPN